MTKSLFGSWLWRLGNPKHGVGTSWYCGRVFSPELQRVSHGRQNNCVNLGSPSSLLIDTTTTMKPPSLSHLTLMTSQRPQFSNNIHM